MPDQMVPALLQMSSKLVEPARWLLVMGIAYSLATTALYFLSAPQAEPTVDQPRTPAASAKRTTSIEDIVARNLFGLAEGGETASAQPVQRAVETRLPLELHGVFVAEDTDASAAIVAQKGKPGLLYTVGDTLPGNASLIEVHTNHIVLRRGGARETLTFPEAKDGQLVTQQAVTRRPTPAPPRSGVSAAGTPADSPRDVVANYRSMIDENPTQALSELGIAPVAEGASSGYRVGGLADSPYLSQTGLQPGDVILSINGRPVGDINQDRMEIDNVLAQGSARLEVQRGTRRFFVTASL